MSDSICSICTEKYNKTKHATICCPFCNYTACRLCVETYLLSQNTAKCMNTECHKEWTRQILSKLMTKTFLNNKYKLHIQNVLLEIQRAMLPETQLLVKVHQHFDNMHELKTNLNKNYLKLQTELAKVRGQLHYVYNEIHSVEYNFILSNNLLNNSVEQFNYEIENGIVNEQNILDGVFRRNNRQRIHGGGDDDNHHVKTQFHRRCGDENCLGYLSTQWKCGLCDCWTCNKCLKFVGKYCSFRKEDNGDDGDNNQAQTNIENINDDNMRNTNEIEIGVNNTDEQHVCNPDDVATASLLKKDSKPCPKCATLIFKIDGCDQMWCTQCHTAFNWRNGTIETKIHNPHYYAWLRENTKDGVIPREQGDIIGGDNLIIDGVGNMCERTDVGTRLEHLTRMAGLYMRTVRTYSNNKYAKVLNQYYDVYKTQHQMDNYVQFNELLTLVGNIHHLYHVEHFEFNKTVTEFDRVNRHLRVNYLRGIIDETKFKQQLLTRQKKYLKHLEISQILEMFIVSSIDIFTRAYHILYPGYNVPEEQYSEVMNKSFQTLFELNKLLQYTNQSLCDVYEYFQSTSKPRITTVFRLSNHT